MKFSLFLGYNGKLSMGKDIKNRRKIMKILNVSLFKVRYLSITLLIFSKNGGNRININLKN